MSRNFPKSSKREPIRTAELLKGEIATAQRSFLNIIDLLRDTETKETLTKSIGRLHLMENKEFHETCAVLSKICKALQSELDEMQKTDEITKLVEQLKLH